MSSYYGTQNQPGNDQGGSGFYNAGGYNQPPMNQSTNQNQASYNYGNPQQWQMQPGADGGMSPSNSNGQFGQQQAPQPQNGVYGAGYGNNQTNVPTPNFWTPATAASIAAVAGTMGNDAAFEMASNMGRSFFEARTAKMIPGLESTMLSLRGYFAVDNNYVLKKMAKVLFPFRSKKWRRQQRGPPSNEYALPTADENAPDLYIPSMSLITYVLLCAFCYGTAKHFDPEVIPDVTTRCFVFQVLEVVAIRFCFHLMQIQVPILDLFSFTGYKYLGLSLNMFVGLLLSKMGYGHRAYYATFLFTASSASYFMLKTMANNIPTVTAANGPKREVMIVAFAVSQFAFMWFVSQTKFL